MSIDITNLTTRLQNSILNLTDATKEDILLLSHSVSKVTADRVVSVATVSDLPDLEAVALGNGTILYVASIDVLVISCNRRWIGLDGRLLRNDASTVSALSWGDGAYGRMGDGTIIGKSSPVTVVGGVTNWSQVSVGPFGHVLAVTDSGIAYGWGYGSYGRLGNNSTLNRSSPVTVVGGITTWKKVGTGALHSAGLTEQGNIYSWGGGGGGKLGTGNTTNRSSPVTLAGTINTWSDVSVGGDFSIGLTKGIIYAWGWNSAGQLGDGTAVSKNSPVTIAGNINSWAQISAGVGGYFSMALRGDGVLYAWGEGNNGQLGNNAATNRSSPVTVVGGITNWSQISTGRNHALALTTAGVLYSWGSNGDGKLGTGNTTNRSSPVTVVGGITNWSKISAGYEHNAAVTSAGNIYVWGDGSYGAIGDGEKINRSSPVTVLGGIATWTFVSAGRDLTVGIRTT
jgi:alpha-tubulin suppressor-like RCC1 family protein